MHYKFNQPAPLELLRWNLVERFHWTLDYIDNLSMADITEFMQIQQGRSQGK